MRIVYRQRVAQQESRRILTLVLLQEHELRKTLHAFGRSSCAGPGRGVAAGGSGVGRCSPTAIKFVLMMQSAGFH